MTSGYARLGRWACGMIVAWLLMGATPVEGRTWRVPPAQDLQQAISLARPGDRLQVAAGVYAGAVAVTVASLSLEAMPGAVLDGRGQGTILQIMAPGVTVSGFQLRHSGRSGGGDDAGLKVVGVMNCRILANRFEDVYHGIYLQAASRTLVRGNVLEGRAPAGSYEDWGDGVHVWNSRDNRIAGNAIHDFRDGFYLEFAAGSRLEQNQVFANRRYGLHFMYMDDALFRRNRFWRNQAGSVLMYSRRLRVERNDFEDHRGPVGDGMLFKENDDSLILGNRLVNNSVGLLMDGSNRNRFVANLFAGNGWGLELYGSCSQNRFQTNSFVANGYDVAVDMPHSRNAFEGNYWSAYHGYDLHGVGHGTQPHAPVAIFAFLAMQYPDLYAFTDSPAIRALAFAQQLLPALGPSDLRDERPLLRPPGGPYGAS